MTCRCGTVKTFNLTFSFRCDPSNASAVTDTNGITVIIGIGLVFSGGSDLFAIIWVSKNAKQADEDESTDLVEIDDTEK